MTAAGQLELLQHALGREDWSAAEALLRAMILHHDGHAGLHYNLALVLRRQHRETLALAAFDAALARDANHPSAGFERAAVLLEMGEHAAAEAGFRSHLARVPDDADARLNLARLALLRQAGEEALDLVSRDGRPEARVVAVEALRDLGRMDEMQAEVSGLAGQHPGLKPVLLKIVSQGPRGRLALHPDELFAPPGTSAPP
jgi:predicted Zn-dependent protease